MVLNWLVLALSLTQMAAAQGIRDISNNSSGMFLYTFTRHGEVHKALVVTAGNRFETGVIKPGSARCVSLLAAIPFDLGDGAGLTIRLANETGQIEGARLYLDPAHIRADRAWKPIRFEIPPNMDHFVLQFTVDAGPRQNYTGDWIGLAAGTESGCLLAE